MTTPNTLKHWGTMECPECEGLGDLRKTRPVIDIIYCGGVKTKIYPSCPTCHGTGKVPRELPPEGPWYILHKNQPEELAVSETFELCHKGECVASWDLWKHDGEWKRTVINDSQDEDQGIASNHWPAIRQFFDTPPDEALAKEIHHGA